MVMGLCKEGREKVCVSDSGSVLVVTGGKIVESCTGTTCTRNAVGCLDIVEVVKANGS